MTQQTYVFDAELVGFPGVRRTITLREDLTLVDLHYALQSAFGWDDDHLYSFWLDGSFWASADAHYMHPYHAASVDPPGRSACARLCELALAEGRRIAYEFDFEREWRVQLELREIGAGDGSAVARCIERVGVVPPQYERTVLDRDDASAQPTVEFPALRHDEVDAA
ncbi:MAG: plasmid pRiA4b ORF-3 family protein [Actinomycetota bacterium]|nr:plasmid pRiA4b ORF-3 family protein [Actinomycetota bacterium]